MLDTWLACPECYDCEDPGLSDHTASLSEGHYGVTADPSTSTVLVNLNNIQPARL